jgi:hypothetical protein
VQPQVVAQALHRLAQGSLAAVRIGFVFFQTFLEGFVEVIEGLDVADLGFGDADDEFADPPDAGVLGLVSGDTGALFGADLLIRALADDAGLQVAQGRIDLVLQGQGQTDGARDDAKGLGRVLGLCRPRAARLPRRRRDRGTGPISCRSRPALGACKSAARPAARRGRRRPAGLAG